jgi:type IV pilus assembly protein PilO
MEVSPQIQSRLDQLAKLSRGARMGVLLGLAVLLGAGYYLGAYKGEAEKLQAMRSKELELQRKLSEVRSIAANIAAFEAEITQLEAQLAVALRQLPNEKQLEVLLADISNLGKTAGVEIKSFKRESEQVHDFYAEVPITVQLEGSYHEIARFFDSVSRLPRIVNMGALDLRVSAATAAS